MRMCIVCNREPVMSRHKARVGYLCFARASILNLAICTHEGHSGDRFVPLAEISPRRGAAWCRDCNRAVRRSWSAAERARARANGRRSAKRVRRRPRFTVEAEPCHLMAMRLIAGKPL